MNNPSSANTAAKGFLFSAPLDKNEKFCYHPHMADSLSQSIPQASFTDTKCFACDKRLRGRVYTADTRDDQIVWVGPDCYSKILASGESGYQPPLGGPRLWAKKETK